MYNTTTGITTTVPTTTSKRTVTQSTPKFSTISFAATKNNLGNIWDLSKIPKESIGQVSACTLNNPKTWSTLNGEKFCGVDLGPKQLDRSEGYKACKAKVALFCKSLYN